MTDSKRHADVLGVRVDVVSTPAAARQIIEWARTGGDHYVCAANAHTCIECLGDPALARAVNAASLVVADGQGVVWALRALGHSGARHVRGVDLMLAVCAGAGPEAPVALFGADAPVLDALRERLARRFPALCIACAIAPSFAPFEPEQNRRYLEQLGESGARIVFVALGCPKQERWMASNSAHLNTVMVGVGAAFEFISGHKAMAPRWMQNAGLEWLFRLGTEPRRLWRRYLTTNPRFVWHVLRQWRVHRQSSGSSHG